MNTLIADPPELELIPGVAEASEGVLAELDLASIVKAIQVRESTITPIMKELLQSRPSSHWGINE